MPYIEPFDMFLGCAVAFVAAMTCIGVRMMRENREAREKRAATLAEIARRAKEKGRSFESSSNRIAWRLRGTLADGKEWTPAYDVAGDRSGNLTTADTQVDWIEGQRLEWRCLALKRDAFAFSFYKRTDKTISGEVVFNPDDKLWWRWRLQARDEALARRAFSPTACALLVKLPLGIAYNTHLDQRTSITLGIDGLVAVLGVDELTPDLVDLWIEANEAVASGERLEL